MIDIQRDLSPAALVRAIEDNSADLLMEMGRAGGGEQREEPNLRWTIGGSPLDYHNCVVRADLAPTDVQEVLAASVQRMQERGVPGTWHVGPSMRPADLAQRLLAAGFTLGGSEPGMAADLHALREDLPAPAGLRVERVRDETGLATWSRTLAQGFGEGEREATWVAATYRVLGYHADDGPWLHYLARLNGKPVGTSTVFLGAGVAGVYFVMTVPEARGRGIGATSTLAGLRDARRLGYRIGILTSSAMGIRSMPGSVSGATARSGCMRRRLSRAPLARDAVAMRLTRAVSLWKRLRQRAGLGGTKVGQSTWPARARRRLRVC